MTFPLHHLVGRAQTAWSSHWAWRIGAVVLVGALSVTGCNRPRPAPQATVTWVDHVGPMFEESCSSCHGGENPAAGYSVATYVDAIARGSTGGPVAVAGDEDSLLLQILDQAGHRAHLAGDLDEEAASARSALVRRWVVDDALAFFLSGYHDSGVLNPDAADFHGILVADSGWTMESCRDCHGQAYQGGMGGSCLSCHPSRPDDCSTCHSRPGEEGPFRGLRQGEGEGAHDMHLTHTERFAASRCEDCHSVPSSFDAPGHLDGVVDVPFGERAHARGAQPIFDSTDGTCSSTACHGAGLEGGQRPEQSWHEPAPSPSCTGCHGMPPETIAAAAPHPAGLRCESCHLMAGPNFTIAEPTQHGDGVVRALEGSEGCSACHAAPGEQAPFRGLDDATDPRHPSVGAHQVHVHGGPFSAGMSCVTCHPDRELDDEGHMSGEVTIRFSGAAVEGGLSPTFDPESRTCSSTWCHGASLTGGAVLTPAWNDPTPLVCGSCHAVPPQSLASGAPHPSSSACGSCHGQVIDDSYRWVDLTRHVDGTVDTGGSP